MMMKTCKLVWTIQLFESPNLLLGLFFYDFMTKEKKRADLNLAPTSSSSGSSGVTQVSSNESEENEESSSCNSLPYFRRKQQQ